VFKVMSSSCNGYDSCPDMIPMHHIREVPIIVIVTIIIIMIIIILSRMCYFLHNLTVIFKIKILEY
jgi:hypothetical protein